MPLYEYECIPHRHRFEVMQKLSEEPLSACKECGGEVRKLISAVGFQLKGGGWYKDGYSSPNKSNSSNESSSSTEPAKKTETTQKTETPNKETKS